MNPMLRSGVLHAASAGAGAIAAVSFAASHSVDLYAIYDQLNTVIAAVTKLLGLLVPFVSGAYAVYKATTAQKLIDISRDPAVKAVITTPELSVAVPSTKVVSSVTAIPSTVK